MFDNVNEKKVITKTQLTITLILVMFFAITGATYAYFAISATNNTMTGEAATVNLTLNVEKIFPAASSENTGVMVPQLSVSKSDTSPLSSALKVGCVDGNQNIVCQVYKIDIQNIGGTATQVVDGMVSFYSDAEMTTDISMDMPNLKWKLVGSVDAVTPSNSVLGINEDMPANYNENVFADDVTMEPSSDSISYYMIIWINEKTDEDQPDKSPSTDNPKRFYGKIEFRSSNGTGVTSTFA